MNIFLHFPRSPPFELLIYYIYCDIIKIIIPTGSEFKMEQKMDSFYYKGLEHLKDDISIVESFYQKGILEGSAKCMYGLAILFLKNYSSSDNRANELFNKAFPLLLDEAKNNDAVSQRMVSCYYLMGNRGVERNIDKAKQWLIKSAENGDVDAQINLADSYKKGDFFEKDMGKTIEWYKKAAEAGSTKAVERLKELENEKNA